MRAEEENLARTAELGGSEAAEFTGSTCPPPSHVPPRPSAEEMATTTPAATDIYPRRCWSPGEVGRSEMAPLFCILTKALWHDRRSASHAGSCCRWQASSMENTQPTSSMWSWMSRVASTWYHRALSAVTELVGLQTSAVGRRESQRRGFHRMICYHRPVRHPSPLEQLDQGSRYMLSFTSSTILSRQEAGKIGLNSKKIAE